MSNYDRTATAAALAPAAGRARPADAHPDRATPANPEHAWPRWSWATLAAVAGVDALWLALAPVSLDGASWVVIALLGLAAFALVATATRADVSPRISVFVIGVAFILLSWPALRILNHLGMMTALPWADATLARWDLALGFDWMAYAIWVDSNPLLLGAMELTYNGLTEYSCAAFVVVLCVFGAARAREFVLIFFVTGVIVTVIGPLWPAEGAMVFYAPAAGSFVHLTAATGTYHLVAMELLRNDSATVLKLRELPGLVTFPSFHTAMGVIVVYCCRGRLAVFLPALALNAVMIASTPVLGSHYVVDVVAGAALALMVAVTVSRSLRRAAGARTERKSPVDPSPA